LAVPAHNPLPGKIVSVMWRAGSAEGTKLKVSTDKRMRKHTGHTYLLIALG